MSATPRTKAHEALTATERAALDAAATRAGGWRALARLWPELSDATLRRVARGDLATPLALFAVRVHLSPRLLPPSTPVDTDGASAPTVRRPGIARALPASPASSARKGSGG